MATLVDGGDGVAVSMAGLDLRIVETWSENWLWRGNAPPGTVAFAAINGVTGQVRFADRLPTEIDRRACGRVSRCGHGSQAGRHCGWKDIDGFDADRVRKRSFQLNRFGVDRYPGHALRPVLIGTTKMDGFIQGSVRRVIRLGGGLDQQILLDRFRRRSKQAL